MSFSSTDTCQVVITQLPDSGESTVAMRILCDFLSRFVVDVSEQQRASLTRLSLSFSEQVGSLLAILPPMYRSHLYSESSLRFGRCACLPSFALQVVKLSE